MTLGLKYVTKAVHRRSVSRDQKIRRIIPANRRQLGESEATCLL